MDWSVIMGCRQTAKLCVTCETKRQRWANLQYSYLPKGEKEIGQFRQDLLERKVKLMYSTHYFANLNNREYTVEDVEKAILHGRIVERNKLVKETTVSYVLLYFAKNKPMHVVLNRLDNENYLLNTVYNPLAHHWKWNSTFDKRICFCDSEH